MNIKNWFAAIGCTAFFISCGENSSKNGKRDNEDTTRTVETTPPVENPAVNTSVQVPDQVRASFSAKYPGATNVTWKSYEPVDWFDWEWSGWPKMDTGDYVVNYTDDGIEYWAWYDEKNNWVGTSSVVADHSSLPAPVSKAVTDNFAGYKIESIRRENDKDMTAYEIKLSKGSDKAKLLVAENGKVLKKTAKTGGDKTKEKNV